mmetsp:Transcript_46116/g.76847  ORF Transcript_46116/g.76847 Transcript_46116/m.76847 type:complete len:201 (+) Transcript_46116:256-858(+)
MHIPYYAHHVGQSLLFLNNQVGCHQGHRCRFALRAGNHHFITPWGCVRCLQSGGDKGEAPVHMIQKSRLRVIFHRQNHELDIAIFIFILGSGQGCGGGQFAHYGRAWIESRRVHSVLSNAEHVGDAQLGQHLLVCCLRSAQEKSLGDLPEQERPQLGLRLGLKSRFNLPRLFFVWALVIRDHLQLGRPVIVVFHCVYVCV